MLLHSLMLMVMLLVSPLGASAASPSPTEWLCDGDTLTLMPIAGSVDISGLPDSVPNIESGTVPGDGVLISWRGQTFQLPRTNNAGPPSYTDGRWWWRAAEPDHPEWKQRRGGIITYTCNPAEPTA